MRWWTKPRTAVEIEGRFPQLGQRIRTVVQYAGLEDEAIDSEGVTPGLVGALNEETEARVEPLPLHSIVPRWRVTAIAMLARRRLYCWALPRWGPRMADCRAAVGPGGEALTTLSVLPGNVLVDQGEDVEIVAEEGTHAAEIMLESRLADTPGFAWKATTLRAPERGPKARRETTLEKVKDPLEYRVVAGPARSVQFKIDVRYPLEIKDFTVTLTPPAYTGLGPSKVKGGDMQAVEGTDAVLAIEFDTPPSQTVLEMSDPSWNSTGKDKSPATPTIVPLRREGKSFVAEMKLMEDRDYKVVAKSADRGPLAKKKYRIDVRQDRAPRVAFEEPEEALEVHPVAEVLKRVRVGDDFGVTKAGIVFRFNDGEEKALTFRDLTAEEGGKPQTSATLEETLLMETLAASPQDSVTYYAFAEDNFPGGPRRTETDLRYIDIRPFQRDYRLADPAGGFPGEPDELATLGELIARRRFNLNRAHRLARHRPTDRVDLEDPLKIAGFEETLLSMTRGCRGDRGDRRRPGRVAAQGRGGHARRGRCTRPRPRLEAPRRCRGPEEPRGGPPRGPLHHRPKSRRRDGHEELRPQAGAWSASPRAEDEEAEQLAAEIEELAQDEDIVYATIAAAMAPERPRRGGGRAGGRTQGCRTQGCRARMPNPRARGSGQGDEGERGSGEPKKVDRRAIAEKQEEIADEVRAARGGTEANRGRVRPGQGPHGQGRRGGREGVREGARPGSLEGGLRGGQGRRGDAPRAGPAGQGRDRPRGRRRDRHGPRPRRGTRRRGRPRPGRTKPRARPETNPARKGPSERCPRGHLTEAERIEACPRRPRRWRRGSGRSTSKARAGPPTPCARSWSKARLAEIVERTERMGELRIGGKPGRSGAEAGAFRQVRTDWAGGELLHAGSWPRNSRRWSSSIDAWPNSAKLATLKTNTEITAWHRDASADPGPGERRDCRGDRARRRPQGRRLDRRWSAWHWGDGGSHRIALRPTRTPCGSSRPRSRTGSRRWS
ncbi:MAG: hypothetical protein WKF75_00820 [Singulisphaera sp.]